MSRSSTGARLDVLQRSLVVAIEATALSPAHRLSDRLFPGPQGAPATARIVLLLFTVPFLINYIVRDVSPGPYLLGRTGVVNSALLAAGIIDAPLDWLLYSDFAVLRRADLVLHAVHDLSAVPVDRRASIGSISRQARCSAHRLSPPSAPSRCRCRCRACLPPASSASSAASAKAPCRSSRRRRLRAYRQHHHQQHGRAELSAGRRSLDRSSSC